MFPVDIRDLSANIILPDPNPGKLEITVIVQPTAKNAKKKLLKNEKKIQEYVRTRLPARLRRSDGYLFGQVNL